MFKPSFPSSGAPLDAFLTISGFPARLAKFAKYEFDKHLYYYGAHFSSGYDRVTPGRNIADYQEKLLQFCAKLQPAIEAELAAKRVPASAQPCVFSNAYFGWEHPLAERGVRLIASPWTAAEPDNLLANALFNQCRAVNELFRSSMAIFYRTDFHAALQAVAGNLERYYALHPARAILMPYTLGFFEGISTDIFRRLGKPVFLCIHGVPARFDWWERGEHPVDYLVVWGEAMKRRIVERGRPADSVLVSGHPEYSGRTFPKPSSSLNRVLVLGFAQNGAPPLDVPHYHDRSLGLDYAWRVQSCLEKLGVKRALFRPHPSESGDWYRSQLDPDFFDIDTARPCAEALREASIVIGPTSTVAIDAVVAGVSYVCFWPSLPHYNPAGHAYYDPDLPFDGSDPRFPVAGSETELVELLQRGATIDPAALSDYVAPCFRPEVVSEKLKSPATPVNTTAPSVGTPETPVFSAASDPAQMIPEAKDVPATPFELKVLQVVRPFTMTPPQVTLNAMRAVEFIEKHAIPGAVVECGVWRGGVSMAMMIQLNRLKAVRPFFMYDTFDGMSEPTADDVSPTGEAATKLLAEHSKDETNHYWAFAPIDRVRRNVEAVGYPKDQVRMVQGKVEDTIPGVIPDRIALLRLDTDWYESTKHELEHLYDRLVPGGIMILDDYGFWQGARKAVDEYFEKVGRKPQLNVVHDQLNSCVRWCVKP